MSEIYEWIRSAVAAEKESNKRKIEGLEARLQETKQGFEKEKSKLICALLASSDEIKRHKKASRNKARKARRARRALFVENENYKMRNVELEMSFTQQRSKYEHTFNNLAARFDEIFVENSKLIKELKASRDEVGKSNKASEKLKSALCEAENRDLELVEVMREEKSKLVEELKASRDEAEKSNMALKILKSAHCKVVSVAIEVKKRNCELELEMKEEKSKLFEELEASREKERMSNKAMEKVRLENENYKMQILELEMTTKEEKIKLVEELEASRDQVEKRDKALENLTSDLSEVLWENENYKMHIKNVETRFDEICVVQLKTALELEASRDEVEKREKAMENLTSALSEVRLENENCEVQIENPFAKNEKKEKTHSGDDWELVEEEEHK